MLSMIPTNNMSLYLALLTYHLPVERKPDPYEVIAELAYWFEVARGGVEEVGEA